MTPAEFKAARRTLGLTQGRLAAILGMDPSHIRRMEMTPDKSSHRPVMPHIALLIRYMLRDQREDRWHGTPRV